MDYKDYYDILGVERTASDAEIKRAYRKLARTYHPDVNQDPGADARFKDAGEAYEVLGDPEKRAAYDHLGQDWAAGQDFRPPPDWDPGFSFSGGGFAQGGQEGFSDFFETLFGHARAGPGGFQARMADQHARIELDLEDAFHGATRAISLTMPDLDPSGRLTFKPTTLRVTIPKGIAPGQQIRLAGQAQGGDLYLEVAFRPHPVYRLEGRDLHLDLPVTPWEAALGGKVRMPTPGGTVDITIPKGARSGQKLRLKRRGLPATPPGDLYATLQIVVPPAETEAGRKFYETMARDMPFDPRRKLGV